MSAHAEIKSTAVPFAGLTGPAGFVAEGVLAAVTSVADLFHGLAQWRREQALVRELSALSDHQLEDIGIARDKIPALVRTRLSNRA
jgi:uncharacterized protein YjiS (DUF1127 family)